MTELTRRRTGPVHRRRPYFSPQDCTHNGKRRSWDPWTKTQPGWTVHRGDYWKLGDSIWHPTGSRGDALTKKLLRRLDQQVQWVFEQPELVRELTRSCAMEAVLGAAFKSADRGDLLHGTVRVVAERVGEL